MPFYKYTNYICQKGLSRRDELSGVTGHVIWNTLKFLMPSFLCVIKLLGAISRRTWECLCFQGAGRLLTLPCDLHLKQFKTTLPLSFCFCRTNCSHQLSENSGYRCTKTAFLIIWLSSLHLPHPLRGSLLSQKGEWNGGAQSIILTQVLHYHILVELIQILANIFSTNTALKMNDFNVKHRKRYLF